jgi:acetyl esterase/lipase
MPSEAHEAIVATIRASGGVSADPGQALDVVAMRQTMEAMMANSVLPESTLCEPVQAGDVPSEWIEGPRADREKVLLYFHGGGYVLGSITTHRALVARIASEAGVRALLIDYRLGPENPYPAAVEDAVRAYRFLLEEGYDPEKIVLGGDSAGGGLTFATLVALREEGEPLPAAAIALSPWVDLEGRGESMQTRADVDPMVQYDGLIAMAALYLGGASATEPTASPLHADLSALPPIYIQVGTAETLLDDSIRIEALIREVGGKVELDLYEDLIHVFQAFAPHVPESIEAIAKLGAFVRREIR